MCTALCMQSDNFYFGRNMDVECGFGERVVVCPRGFALDFKFTDTLPRHYAVMGTAAIVDGYPLYADAFNEKGLCMAGLNFPHTAFYFKDAPKGKLALAPFELIPFVLGRCETTEQAERELERIAIIAEPFSESIPLTPLHWIVADKRGSLAVEPTEDGLKVYKNPVGVLTNEPPFPYHLAELGKYSHLTPKQPSNSIFPEITRQSLGLGAFGLAGDYSSASRFSKAAFLASVCNLPDTADEQHKVAHFFRLLYSVAPPYGAVLAYDGKPHYSLYSCCMNATSAIYYVCAYDSLSVSAKTMSESDMNGKDLISYFH